LAERTESDLAYTFKRGKSVQKNVRRVAESQVKTAIEEIDDSELSDNDTIHQVRKRCKKLRGLVRLVRPCFPSYKTENAAFRDAARELSVLRDIEAMLESHDQLLEFYSGEVDGAAFAPVRAKLLQQMDDAMGRNDLHDKLARFREAMTDAKIRIGDWRIEADGFDALRGGLSKTYKRAREAMEHADAEGTAEALHEWRKRVKYHWYHTRLLRDIWPEAMTVHGDAAKELSDLLGEHHDLAVLQGALPDLLDHQESEMKSYLGLIQGRQAILETKSLTQGRKIFAEKPSALEQRWEAYWDAWQEEDAIAPLERVA
jgi:CHAD domain-containing protein